MFFPTSAKARTVGGIRSAADSCKLVLKAKFKNTVYIFAGFFPCSKLAASLYKFS